MGVVATEVSPLNCRWIGWESGLPVCTRPLSPRHHVTEADCAVCEFWDADAAPHAQPQPRDAVPHPKPKPAAPPVQDPLNRETCPRCASHDVVLMHRDALVQSFSCSICHQRWLATRPWPLLRETRSRHAE